METQVLDTVLAVFSFVLGGMVGSFLNVCVYRLPRNESVVKPRSHCPQCGTLIAWYDNMPVVSWLLLGAKCRHCSKSISWQYPVVEAITALLFFLVYWRFGMTLATPVYMLLAAGLVLCTFVDLTDWTIPNEITMPGIPLGVLLSVVATFYPASGLYIEGPFQVPIFNSLTGLLVGGGSLYLLDQLSLMLLKKRGMGFGDVKLLAMLGAFLGLYNVFFIIMAASVLGSLVGIPLVLLRKGRGDEEEAHYFPFGPYLCVAGLLAMYLGPQVIEFYSDFTTPASLM